MKRFLSMQEALKSTVQSAQYIRFEFVDDTFKNAIVGNEKWTLMRRIVDLTGPILLLLRLADSNAATMSKLKATVDYLKASKFVDTGRDTLEDKIAVAFINRAPEFECDIASAAYVLDPQFVFKSRNANRDVMNAFWRVARKVMRLNDENDWNLVRPSIVSELSNFRMKTGGFTCENYNEHDTCAFWGVAGCHAPTLKNLAFLICSLPCSSGSAERNWKELKFTYTKTRSRLDKDRLAKMIFVRRFMKLKMKICLGNDDTDFNDWVKEMLDQFTVEETTSTSSSATDSDEDTPFVDHMEPMEQLRINGMRGGKRKILLTNLKKDNAAKSWLFRKYYKMHFVDKNPEDPRADAPALDENEWEHRVIKDICWSRGKGWSVETFLRDGITNQSIEPYQINENLHEMIRNSPYNTRRMLSSGEVTGSEVDGDDDIFDTDSNTDN